MPLISLQWRRTNVRPFSSAVVAWLVSLSATLVLARVAWRTPALRVPAAVFILLILALALHQLLRIRRLYQAASDTAASGDSLLRQALNEVIRTYLWGNVAFLLLSLAVFRALLFLR